MLSMSIVILSLKTNKNDLFLLQHKAQHERDSYF